MIRFRFATMATVTLVAFVNTERSSADYLGMVVFPHTIVDTPLGPRVVWRLYAHFSSPNDSLVSWYGSSPAAATIESRLRCDPNTPGDNFYQVPTGRNTAPPQKLIDVLPHAQWETFATIGVSIADQGIPTDQTILTVPFPTFITGNTWTSSAAGVFCIETAPQVRADFAGDGDLQLRVLMAQLTLPFASFPKAKVNLTWRNTFGTWIQETNEEPDYFVLASMSLCCLPDRTCQFMTGNSCQLMGGITIHGCKSTCADCARSCPADVSPTGGDGEVNIDDLLLVVNNWGSGAGNAADINGNGIVDIDDLLAVINGWGPCS